MGNMPRCSEIAGVCSQQVGWCLPSPSGIIKQQGTTGVRTDPEEKAAVAKGGGQEASGTEQSESRPKRLAG